MHHSSILGVLSNKMVLGCSREGSRIQNRFISPDNELEALFIDKFKVTVCDQYLSIIMDFSYYFIAVLATYVEYSLRFLRPCPF
jgi:hypothetical protein